MAAYTQLKIRHTPQTTYPSYVQNSFVGAQSIAGNRGVLPNGIKVGAADDTNVYSVSKLGKDSNAGTNAVPFLTMGKAFAPDNVNFLTDYSTGGYTLTQVGTVPQVAYPCYPAPASGDFMAGPFTDANYFQQGGSFNTAFSNSVNYTIESYINITSFANANNMVWQYNDGGASNYLNVISDGSVSFTINGVSITAPAATLVINQDYYIACTMDLTGSKLYIGTSPENAKLISSNATARTVGGIANFTIGRDISTASRFFNGYISRFFVSSGNAAQTSAARTSFPTRLYSSFISGSTSTKTSFLIGAYYFQTLPLMVTAYKSYVAIGDNGNYNEGFRFNFPYELPSANTIGVYAKDGFTPTFNIVKGAIQGTYGAGNSTRVLYTATPDYYVAKSGSDSNSGAIGSPFLTFQKAVTTIGTATNKLIQVQDSGIYQEDIVFGAIAGNVYIQAASGQTPSIRAKGITATSINLSAKAAVTFLYLNGLTFDGLNNLGSLAQGLANGKIFFTDCSIKNYTLVISSSGNVAHSYTSIRNSSFQNISNISLDTSGGSISDVFNSFFNFKTLNGVQSSASIQGYGANLSVTQSSFYNAILTVYTDKNDIVDKNYFYNCDVTIYSLNADTTTMYYTSITNNYLNLSKIKTSNGTGIQTIIINSNFVNALNLTYGIDVIGATATPAANVLIQNNVVYGATTGILTSASFTSTSRILNNTCITCTTGLNTAIATIGYAYSGLGTAVTGVTPTFYETAATIANNQAASLNATLISGDPGIYSGNGTATLDMGFDYSFFNIVVPNVTLNGLTLKGLANCESGISSTNNTALNIYYCSFTTLGTYGIKASDSSIVNNCYFNINGHAIKTNGVNTSFSNNVGFACGGSLILNYGISTTSSYNTAYFCDYGQYDIISSVSTIIGCIYSNSGTYDYSGNSIPTYCDIGTLDPAQVTNTAALLGVGCIQNDPIFVNVITGDLRLQTLATGFYWDSPCKGAGPAGVDMGAFSVTYGSAVTTWKTIDFATSGYRNPDSILRKQIPVKIAEGDREDGAIYSVAATYKKEYEMTWKSSTSDMFAAQLSDLEQMFLGPDNAIQVDFGSGYIDCFLGRSIGFDYTEMTGFYDQDTTPKPLRALNIREK